jgi:hypothetical protein
MARPIDALLLRCAIQFGVKIVTPLARVFLHFYRDPVRIGPGILADAGDLPGNLHVRLVRPDAELMVGHLAAHDGLGELSDHRELVAEVAVESFEPVRQGHNRSALGIRRRIAVLDVHHIRRFDERMIEALVRRIERVVDLERASAFGGAAVDAHIANEIPGVAGLVGPRSPGICQDSLAPESGDRWGAAVRHDSGTGA